MASRLREDGTSADAPAESQADVRAELLRLRQSIDNMDAALVHLLAERFKITQQVGVLKARHGLPAADPARETEQITRLRALAAGARLDPEFAEKFLGFIVAEVVHHHEAIAGVRSPSEPVIGSRGGSGSTTTSNPPRISR